MQPAGALSGLGDTTNSCSPTLMMNEPPSVPHGLHDPAARSTPLPIIRLAAIYLNVRAIINLLRYIVVAEKGHSRGVEDSVRRHRDRFGEFGKPAAQRKNKPPEQFAEIGPGSGQNDVDRIALQPAQEAAPHTMVAFQMADLRFDRTASPPSSPFTARNGF